MDSTETIARAHLVFRGHADPVYEPDGNVPPDFLVDGRIAVEVRRLNENVRGLLSPKGLEETTIPMLKALNKLCDSFGAPSPQRWWLSLRYRRPAPQWRALEPVARRFLEEIRDGVLIGRHTRQLGDNVEMSAIPRVGSGDAMFRVLVDSDGDRGGMVVDEVERNLRLCIDDKTQKTEAFRHLYPIWWLLFVDHVAFGLSEYDWAQFDSAIRITHTWDKVILVNPFDPTRFHEL